VATFLVSFTAGGEVSAAALAGCASTCSMLFSAGVSSSSSAGGSVPKASAYKDSASNVSELVASACVVFVSSASVEDSN